MLCTKEKCTGAFIGEYMRFITMVLFLLISITSFAEGYFDNLRYDRNTPAKCLETKIDDFLPAGDLKFFTVGIQGAQNKGFSFEYPITRSEAGRLWKPSKQYLDQGGQAEYPKLPKLDHYSEWALPLEIGQDLSSVNPEEIIKSYAPEMNFTLGNEGEVLELLASLALERSINPKKYFVTGSVAYRGVHGTRTLGELDLIVAERETCTIVAVGEVKLGLRGLSKAMKQLKRFHGFLKEATGDHRAKFEYAAPALH